MGAYYGGAAKSMPYRDGRGCEADRLCGGLLQDV